MGVRVEEEVDVHQRKEKKKKKKKNDDAYIVDGGATTEIMVEEDFGEESRKKKHDKKKRKRQERERGEGISVGYEEANNDFGVVVTKENKSWKKAKNNKMGYNDDGFDRGCKINDYESDPNVKSHLGQGKVGRSSNTIGNETEFGDVVKLDAVKDATKKKKKRKNKNKEAVCSYLTEIVKDRKFEKDRRIEGLENYEGAEISDTTKGEDRGIVKKKNEKKRKKDNKVSNVGNIDKEKDHVGGCCWIETESVKKNKKGNKYKDDAKHHSREMVEKLPIKGESVALDDIVEMENSDTIKRKKDRSIKDVGENLVDKEGLNMKIRERNADDFINSGHRKSDKRVKFASNIEVFSPSDGTNAEKKNEEKMSSYGKWYSQEEDKMIKDAVFDYIEKHGLGEEGLKMVLNIKSYPQVRGCWKDISAALPWRSCQSVTHRAHVLFERDENRKWTAEEKELVKKFHAKNGPKWKTLATELGKSRGHVKDTWRRIRLPNQKKGRWSQEEYQTLFDLVNMDLRMKAAKGRESNQLLRDNISWEAISTKMGTRTNVDCCHKWYDRLASSMVKDGKWAPIDDYYLVNALLTLDACCVEDVNWDDLIEDRPGDVCRRRFKQMINHLGEYGMKSFPQQVEVLAKRYCPDIIEVREIADGNTVVE